MQILSLRSAIHKGALLQPKIIGKECPTHAPDAGDSAQISSSFHFLGGRRPAARSNNEIVLEGK